MALIEIHADPHLLRDLVNVLGRIADALERAYPAYSRQKRASIGPDSLIRTTDEQLWEMQTKNPGEPSRSERERSRT